jgi:predicted small metal-binding protein
MKTLACKDMGIDCGFVAKGETDEEVIKKTNDHTTKAHHEVMEEMSKKMSEEEMKKKMKSMIKEV